MHMRLHDQILSHSKAVLSFNQPFRKPRSFKASSLISTSEMGAKAASATQDPTQNARISPNKISLIDAGMEKLSGERMESCERAQLDQYRRLSRT